MQYNYIRILTMESEKASAHTIPDNFRSIISDFTNDLSITFPEYSYLWMKWGAPDLPQSQLQYLFEYILTVMPERFFDILYQNMDMFKPDSNINTCFLPDVDFKMLFNCEGVSEHTHQTMWKYMQLLLFSILNCVKNKASFGETMNMFEGIDETELQSKLAETMEGLTSFFTDISSQMEGASEKASAGAEGGDIPSNFGEDAKEFAEKMFGGNMPNPAELHEHLKGLFDGKIGKLAKEMAEEITSDITGLLGEDDGSIRTSEDVIKKLMKDPQQMMKLVKTIGAKLSNKMQSGEISQEEIMKEASELFSKMKGMNGGAGAELFQNLTKQMQSMGAGLGGLSALAGLGKNTRLDVNAMGNQMKKMSMREKLKERLDKKRELQAQQTAVMQAMAAAQQNAAAAAATQHVSIDQLMEDLQLTNDVIENPHKSNGGGSGKKKKKGGKK